jgi:hypothetical protein
LISFFVRLETIVIDPILQAMDRFTAICLYSPAWGASVKEFVTLNPEFKPFLKYTAVNREADIPSELKTIKDMLLYYVSFAGVNTNYGEKVWTWVKAGQLDKLTAKKRAIIDDILKLPEITNIDEFDKIDIKGVGDGAHTFVRQHYFHDKNIIYPTDRIFQKGICKIYGIDKITATQAKHKANLWKGEKSVGSMFCFQAAHYATPLTKVITTPTPSPSPTKKMPMEMKAPTVPIKKIAIKLKG